MFAPLVANIVTRLVTREGWSNTLLAPELPPWLALLPGSLVPADPGTIVGGAIYFLLFPSRFDPSMTWARDAGLLGTWKDTAPGTFFIVQIGAALAMSATLGLLLAFGEEFGWRAYLLPKLMPLGGRKAVLWVGIIHGIWHWPSSSWDTSMDLAIGVSVVGPLLFLVFTLSLSVFLCWSPCTATALACGVGSRGDQCLAHVDVPLPHG